MSDYIMNVENSKYTTVTHHWQGEDWILHPLKGMYWKRKRKLLVTDLHLGKTSHFRRSGIHLPPGSDETTLDNLSQLIREFSPAEVWVLGDLFHSRYEAGAWSHFSNWLKQYPQIDWSLVLGNHDIINARHYREIGISCFDRHRAAEGIELIHEPDDQSEDYATVSGHVHPGVELRGKGRQRLVLPCFYFRESSCIMPALGRFTGLGRLEVKAQSGAVFVTAEDQVIPLSTEGEIVETDKS